MNVNFDFFVSPRLAQFLARPEVSDLQTAVRLWEANKAAGVGLEAGGELLDAALIFGVIEPKNAARMYKARLDATPRLSPATRVALLERWYDRFMAEAISLAMARQDEYKRNCMEWAW